MNSAFGIFALAGLLVTALVHVASVAGADVQSSFPAVWGLHVGVFVVFVPMVFQLNRLRRASGPQDFFRGHPPWTRVAVYVLAGYVALNFFVFSGHFAGGSPGRDGDRYVLKNKGAPAVEISELEYHTRRADEIRGISGHWLIFYFLPFTHFFLRKRDPADGGPTA